MFADRLEALMSSLNVNNRDLASYSELDPSSLSRLHNGTRIPAPKSVTVKKIILGTYRYADDTDNLNVLCHVTGADINSDQDDICASISAWLFVDQPSVPPLRGI